MFCIRRMREEDLADVARLEKEIFSDPWSENTIRESMEQSQTLLLSALEDGVLVGYLIVYYVLEDGEIARIAVESDFRRNRCGFSFVERTGVYLCGQWCK